MCPSFPKQWAVLGSLPLWGVAWEGGWWNWQRAKGQRRGPHGGPQRWVVRLTTHGGGGICSIRIHQMLNVTTLYCSNFCYGHILSYHIMMSTYEKVEDQDKHLVQGCARPTVRCVFLSRNFKNPSVSQLDCWTGLRETRGAWKWGRGGMARCRWFMQRAANWSKNWGQTHPKSAARLSSRKLPPWGWRIQHFFQCRGFLSLHQARAAVILAGLGFSGEAGDGQPVDRGWVSHVKLSNR